MKDQFAMLASYNTWVNRRLYDAVSVLPDADYRADLGAFFSSLHGTLNHLLLGDRIWLQRFTGTGEVPAGLDAILFDGFAALRKARIVEDARIERYIADLTPEALCGTLRYRTTRQPAEIEQRLAPLLLHFFNHQTHHRGQAHGLLTRLTGEAPSFDLLIFQRQTGISLVGGQGCPIGAPEQRPGGAGR
jgi:uncharacterized damage-inducible protein DinB